jgi:hypothetical protein
LPTILSPLTRKQLDRDKSSPTPQVSRGARKNLIKVSSVIGSDSPSALSLLYIIIGTPILNRIKKTIKSPPPVTGLAGLQHQGLESEYIGESKATELRG